MSARKNRPDQDCSVVLPSIPRDEKKHTKFISDLAAKVMRAADPVGDYLRVVVGENSQLVRIDEALEKVQEMLYAHYGLKSPQPATQRQGTVVGFGLQYACA